MGWLCVEGPAIKLPLPSPLACTMASHTIGHFQHPCQPLFLMAKGSHPDLWHLKTNQVQFLQDCLSYISKTVFFWKSHLCIRE